MNLDFAVNLIQSCVIGAAAVSAISVTADRFGSKLAGVLAGFPSTVAASLFFQARPPAGSIERAVEATLPVPMMMGFFAILLACYVAILGRGLWFAFVASLAVWAALAVFSLSFGRPTFAVSWVVCLLCGVGSFYYIEVLLKVPSSGGRKVILTFSQAGARCAAGAGVVGTSYVVGQLSGPILGGVAAAFPAVTMSSLVVTYYAGGQVLSAALAKSIMISGLVNVSCYSAAVRYLYPVLGVWWGTLAAFALSCVSGLVTWSFLKRVMS